VTSHVEELPPLLCVTTVQSSNDHIQNTVNISR